MTDITFPAEYGTQCWIDFSFPWQWQVYMSLVSLSIFIIPALIIAVCYTTITVTIWRCGDCRLLNLSSQEYFESFRRSRVMQPPLVTYAILPRGISVMSVFVSESCAHQWLPECAPH